MLIALGLFALGGVLLYYGAEWLVKGAAGLANAWGVGPLLIGMTIVSYGTSAPELVVSLFATTGQNPEISLGNVVGSNIANIGLILGLTALIAPPFNNGRIIKREVPYLLVATLAVPVVLLDGVISFVEGTVFVIGAVAFTLLAIRWAKGEEVEPLDELEDAPQGVGALLGLTAVGLVALVAGGKCFVDGAVGVALGLGFSKRIVGLTVVAFGTSVPELAASVMAASKGHSELAIGNVVGSNLFNILLILGVTSLIHPIHGQLGVMLIDLGFMLTLTVLLAVSVSRTRTVSRAEGVAYCAIYAAFIGVLIVFPH